MRSIQRAFAAALLATAVVASLVLPGSAQDGVVARVNGKPITEADLKLAEQELIENGADVNGLPPQIKRRVIAEYLIELQLFADAAETEKAAEGPAFDQRLGYWKRRAQRDAYFDKRVKGDVSEADAKRIYDAQLGGRGTEEEVRARHILVDTEEKARDVFEKLAHGDDFAQMAKAHSKDPGSKENGGDLGFFGKGQMVPEFEAIAFKLKPGEVSQPVKSQFGWHIIKVEERRQGGAPEFAAVKDRIMLILIQRRAKEVAESLRAKAKVEMVDPTLAQPPAAPPKK